MTGRHDIGKIFLENHLLPTPRSGYGFEDTMRFDDVESRFTPLARLCLHVDY